MEDFEITASTLVFNTTELLELILSHLTLLEIIRLAPTSKSIHTTIFTSPPLKRKLFLTAPKSPLQTPPSDSASDSDTDSPPSTPSTLEPTLFNPALSALLPGLALRDLSNGWLLLSFGALPKPPPPKTASFKPMLLTTQPLTRLRIEPAALHTDPATGTVPTRALSRLQISNGPDPREAARISALHQRLSQRRENSPRFGGPGERPPPMPVQTTLRWAAARGEASADGWVWGTSLEFVRGKRLPDFGECESFVCDRAGVRVGDVERIVRNGRGWGWWVVRREG